MVLTDPVTCTYVHKEMKQDKKQQRAERKPSHHELELVVEAFYFLKWVEIDL